MDIEIPDELVVPHRYEKAWLSPEGKFEHVYTHGDVTDGGNGYDRYKDGHARIHVTPEQLLGVETKRSLTPIQFQALCTLMLKAKPTELYMTFGNRNRGDVSTSPDPNERFKKFRGTLGWLVMPE